MTQPADHVPAIPGPPPLPVPTDVAARAARTAWGLSGTITRLSGERDQNFLLTGRRGERFLLKVSSPTERRDILEAQNEAMERVDAAAAGLVARPLPSLDGHLIETILVRPRDKRMMRLFPWIEGVRFSDVRQPSASLLTSLGRSLAKIDLALDSFAPSCLRRAHYWDLAHAPALIAQHAARVRSRSLRAAIDATLEYHELWVQPRLGDVRTATIHGDANDSNFLVDPIEPAQLAGVLDFGDMVRSKMVFDPAIAVAYSMIGRADPIATAAQVISGYHEAYPLTADELAVLFPLARLRLAVSACVAAVQCAEDPENDHLGVSQAGIGDFLPLLAEIEPPFAEASLRLACGLPAATDALVPSLCVSDVLDPAPGQQDWHSIDVGTSSADVPNQMMSSTQSTCGCVPSQGQYERPTVFDERGSGRYVGPPSIAQLQDRAFHERPSVHLGLDLAGPEGTEILAPFRGRVTTLDGRHGTVVVRNEAVEDVLVLVRGLDFAGTRLGVGDSVDRRAPLGTIRTQGADSTPCFAHVQLLVGRFQRPIAVPSLVRPQDAPAWQALSPQINTPQLATSRDGHEDLVAWRARRLSPSLSLSYERPLTIVRGEGSYLFDDRGRTYIDCVNNISHVGHEHPRVVAALHRQARVLNTNTRYLHPSILHYAERLSSLLPEPLEVCCFVNSGSEANELALRIAGTATERQTVVAMTGAYHGNTQALIDISSYKHHGPGGRGTPPWVRCIPRPDPLRDDGDYAAEACREVDELIASGTPPAAFVCEPIMGCGGQLVLPPGYLPQVFAKVRSAGGVCIADEVQTGFGRVGTHRWAFEAHGVVPDIVTLGKPMGNGHPLAGVVMTRKLADSFANGMEFFSSFGGNPVSATVGLAVLDVIHDENLQENARLVGAHILERLRATQQAHAVVADVRGSGLFLGVELVGDGATLSPAPRLARRVVEDARGRGVLLATDGPHDNVIKIKPPLSFSRADADVLCDELARALGQAAREGVPHA